MTPVVRIDDDGGDESLGLDRLEQRRHLRRALERLVRERQGLAVVPGAEEPHERVATPSIHHVGKAMDPAAGPTSTGRFSQFLPPSAEVVKNSWPGCSA